MVSRRRQAGTSILLSTLTAALVALAHVGCGRPVVPARGGLAEYQQTMCRKLAEAGRVEAGLLATMRDVINAIGKPDLWGALSFDGSTFCTSLMEQGVSPTDRADMDWAYWLGVPGRYLALRFGAGELMTHGVMCFQGTGEVPPPLREREMLHKLFKGGPSPTMAQVVDALGKPDLWGAVSFGGREFNTSLMTTHRLLPTGSQEIDWAYALGAPGRYLAVRFGDGRLSDWGMLYFRVISDP